MGKRNYRPSKALFTHPAADSGKWASVAASDPPSERSFHAAIALDKERLLILGGRDADDFELDDFYLLDIKAKEWAEPDINDDPAISTAPSGRYAHAMALLPEGSFPCPLFPYLFPNRPFGGSSKKLVVYGGLAEIDEESGAPDAILTDLLTADAGLKPLGHPALLKSRGLKGSLAERRLGKPTVTRTIPKPRSRVWMASDGEINVCSCSFPVIFVHSSHT